MSEIVVFDIETIARPIPESFKKGILDGHVKTDYKLTDPKKIWEKIKEKFWAQPEGAKPICIGLCTIDLTLGIVSERMGLQTDNEKDLSAFFVDTINEMGCQIKLVGFNSRRFDFPILENMICKTGLKLNFPVGKWDHIDIAEHVPQFFSAYRSLKAGPTSVAALYEVEHSGGSGDAVAEMWEVDKKNGTTKVLEYCKEDVKVTAEIFLKISKLMRL